MAIGYMVKPLPAEYSDDCARIPAFGAVQFASTQRIIALLERAGLPVNSARDVAQELLPHMLRDKRGVSGGCV